MSYKIILNCRNKDGNLEKGGKMQIVCKSQKRAIFNGCVYSSVDTYINITPAKELAVKLSNVGIKTKVRLVKNRRNKEDVLYKVYAKVI